MDKTTVFISGIEVHVYGLQRVQRDRAKEVDAVFVLHGRTQSYADYEKAAYSILAKSYSTSFNNKHAHRGRGLLVVLFDQRNHGHRKVSELANQTWTSLPQPNPTHAQDMFSIYYGTAHDTSLLITFLPHFLFSSPSPTRIVNHICTGISLGGHATYCVLSDDPRVRAGVVVIGCPDYRAIMTQRAATSSTTTTTIQNQGCSASATTAVDGAQQRLPPAFMSTVDKLGPDPQKVAEKDLLILKGDEDALVPWSASEEWVRRLPRDKAEVVGHPGVGHAFTDEMKEKMAGWIDEWRQKH